jgi:hypothetical protein
MHGVDYIKLMERFSLFHLELGFNLCQERPHLALCCWLVALVLQGWS